MTRSPARIDSTGTSPFSVRIRVPVPKQGTPRATSAGLVEIRDGSIPTRRITSPPGKVISDPPTPSVVTTASAQLTGLPCPSSSADTSIRSVNCPSTSVRSRSLIWSVPPPPEKTNRSRPSPPLSVSFPAPPAIVSFPDPPEIVSFPASPLRTSLPSPPSTVSLPSPPRTVSLSAPPNSASLPPRPSIRSLPAPPSKML